MAALKEYNACKARIKSRTADVRDEIFVHMFDLTEKALRERGELYTELDTLKKRMARFVHAEEISQKEVLDVDSPLNRFTLKGPISQA